MNSEVRIVIVNLNSQQSVGEDWEDLVEWFRQYSSCAVAFSAGVDSSVVALAAKKALGQMAYAVTSDSPSFAAKEMEEARGVANEIGIQLFVVEQDDLRNSDYVRNNVSRCYYCRKNLAEIIRPIAARLRVDLCVDGTHVDDLQTPRPGIKALREAGFKAPLVELQLGKDRVREIARRAGLSNWNRPSEACLSSRIAYGQQIDLQTLRKVESAELTVKKITAASIVRVRTIGTKAIVEVDRESVDKALAKKSDIVHELTHLGYNEIEIDNTGYVSGKMLKLFVEGTA